MNIAYKKKDSFGKQLSYYVYSLKKRKGNAACSCSNLKSDYIDNLVISHINSIDLNIKVYLI